MAEALDVDAQQGSATDRSPDSTPTRQASNVVLWRTLAIVGIAALSAGIAYAIVRATVRRPEPDPTSERIQSLIDEANRLLKTLDDQKRA
jgi:hypothetical protein